MDTNTAFFLPEALRAMNNWCLWKLDHDAKGRLTKVPYAYTGKKAASSDRNTWSSFNTVSSILTEKPDAYNGYGLMIADGLVFIDIDHCISADGCIDKRGQDILSGFPESYIEISQSGTGIHIITKGKLSRGFNNRKHGVEAYSSGRFCAMTGNVIQACDPVEEQAGIDYVYNKFKTHSSADSHTNIYTNIGNGYSDSWIIHHASNIQGQRGHDFYTLFHGDDSNYSSASEADQAFCTLLAFWTDRNPEQIDRIFRQSGLYRPKWERKDYRERTIKHACEHIPESLSEYQQRMNREKAKAIAAEQ